MKVTKTLFSFYLFATQLSKNYILSKPLIVIWLEFSFFFFNNLVLFNIIWSTDGLQGRFYFGHFVGDSTGCDSDVSTVIFFTFLLFCSTALQENELIYALFQLHAGIAEVAAAKARMFVNKPDGSKSPKMISFLNLIILYFIKKRNG